MLCFEKFILGNFNVIPILMVPTLIPFTMSVLLLLYFVKQTDKTMAELEIDINMRIREWDVIQVRDILPS